jgi:hypothetical protein
MGGISCTKCKSAKLVRGAASMGCPVCGARVYDPCAAKGELWAEHRAGLMYRRGGWEWIDVLDVPRWFVEEVM